VSPAGGPGFWSAGGEVLATGGRVLTAGRAQALEAFYASLLTGAADPAVRIYLERRRAELALARAEARRWSRAAGPAGRRSSSSGTALERAG
jgi:hypothetical protein